MNGIRCKCGEDYSHARLEEISAIGTDGFRDEFTFQCGTCEREIRVGVEAVLSFYPLKSGGDEE